ncbi:MAG: hypothetical protein ACTSRK_20610, partial [Promethearchaeota archaeon]
MLKKTLVLQWGIFSLLVFSLVAPYLGGSQPIISTNNNIVPQIDISSASITEIPFIPNKTVVELSQTNLSFYDNRGLLDTALSKYASEVELPPMTSLVATYWWADALRHADAYQFAVFSD